MTTRQLLFAGILALVAGAARTAAAQPVELRELGEYKTQGVAVIGAPVDRVYPVMVDYGRWSVVLSDIDWVKIKSGSARDAVVTFSSRALEHKVTVKFDNVTNRVVRFGLVDGPPGARASGDYRLEPIDNGARTRITAVLYMDVVGVTSVFVRDKTIRNMRQAKLRADLGDLSRYFGSGPR